MKKTPTLIVFVCALAYNLTAQPAVGLRIFSPQFSSFTKPVGAFKEPQNSHFTNKHVDGLLLGVSFRIPLKKNYLHTELLYSMRGEEYTYKTSTLDGYNVETLDGESSSIEYYLKYNTNYIEIPVMYCLDLVQNSEEKVHLFLSGGMSAGFNVVSTFSRNSFSVKSPGSFFSGIKTERYKENVSNVNPFILNLVADIDFEFRRSKVTKFFGYARFNRSLTSVYSDDDMNTQLITAGFGFGLRWHLKQRE